MLFDPRPKASRDELFDREVELSILDRLAERGGPLALVLGIRRIGKTSLLKSFLSEWTGVYVDVRGVRTRADLFRVVGEGLSLSRRVRRLLEGVRGIRVSLSGVEIRWRGRDSISLAGLLHELGRSGERVVVVFDEAQALRPPISAEVREAIAYAYDNVPTVSVILSGSEVGLLRDFVGVDDPDSPLYGRYALELGVRRFSPDESAEFLREGFTEEGVEVPEDIIEEAVKTFDGIVGWLVYFGRMYVDGVRDISRVVEAAVETALKELMNLRERERLVLKAIAEGARTWSSVRAYVEEVEGTSIPKASLSRTIKKLEKLSIIHNYEFLDPIYEKAAKRLRRGERASR